MKCFSVREDVSMSAETKRSGVVLFVSSIFTTIFAGSKAMWKSLPHDHFTVAVAGGFMAVLLYAGIGFADSVTYDFAIHSSDAGQEWQASTDVPQFDPALGALQSVTLSASELGGNFQISYQNGGPSPVTDQLLTHVYSYLEALAPDPAKPGSYLTLAFVGSDISNTPTVTLSSYSGQWGDQGTDEYTNSVVGEQTQTTIVPATSSVVGTGVITLLGLTGDNIWEDPANHVYVVSWQGTADYVGALTYTYTATSTPEPSTLVLLGVAALGLLGYARRRVSRQIVTCLAVAIVALAAGSAPAHGDIIDGGFETTSLNISADSVNTYQSQYDYQGQYPSWGAVADVMNDAGPFASVQTINGGASEGSQYVNLSASTGQAQSATWGQAILGSSFSFTASAGQTLQFDYRMSTSFVGGPMPGSNPPFTFDLGQVGAEGGGGSIVVYPGDSAAWSTESIAITNSGLYQLNFAVYAYTEGATSASVSVGVNNVRLVPEPSTLILLGIAAIVLPGYARQRGRCVA